MIAPVPSSQCAMLRVCIVHLQSSVINTTFPSLVCRDLRPASRARHATPGQCGGVCCTQVHMNDVFLCMCSALGQFCSTDRVSDGMVVARSRLLTRRRICNLRCRLEMMQQTTSFDEHNRQPTRYVQFLFHIRFGCDSLISSPTCPIPHRLSVPVCMNACLCVGAAFLSSSHWLSIPDVNLPSSCCPLMCCSSVYHVLVPISSQAAPDPGLVVRRPRSGEAVDASRQASSIPEASSSAAHVWPPSLSECVRIHGEALARHESFMSRKKDPALKEEFKTHFEQPLR